MRYAILAAGCGRTTAARMRTFLNLLFSHTEPLASSSCARAYAHSPKINPRQKLGPLRQKQRPPGEIRAPRSLGASLKNFNASRARRPVATGVGRYLKALEIAIILASNPAPSAPRCPREASPPHPESNVVDEAVGGALWKG